MFWSQTSAIHLAASPTGLIRRPRNRVAAVCLSDDSRRADFLELIENQEWVARIFGERFYQGMHRLQRFFAGKKPTFFKTVDLPPGKLPRLVEQQWKRFTIRDSTKGALCSFAIISSKIGCRIDSVQFARLLVWLKHGSRLWLRIVRATYGPWQAALRAEERAPADLRRRHACHYNFAVKSPGGATAYYRPSY